jgi:hypothetical protein
MGRRSKGTLPQVCLHASSGQARVRIKGTEIWLGRHGSPEAQRRYDQLILQLVEERLGGLPLSLSPEVSAETEASVMAVASSVTRSPTKQPSKVPEAVAVAPQQDDHGRTVAEVCWKFFCYANRHYRDPSGKPTSTLGNIKAAIRALRKFDDISAESFGPLLLESLMYQLVEEPVEDGPVSVKGKRRTRHGVNRIIKSVRFIFNWAARWGSSGGMASAEPGPACEQQQSWLRPVATQLFSSEAHPLQRSRHHSTPPRSGQEYRPSPHRCPHGPTRSA